LSVILGECFRWGVDFWRSVRFWGGPGLAQWEQRGLSPGRIGL
jgi:hypothetical protein